MASLDHDLSASPTDPREPAEPILDLQVLQELRMLQARGNPDMLRRVAALFTERAPGILAALREALDRQDCKGLTDAAHSLKSSSGNLGAARLTDLCARVERLARSESLDGMPELLAAVETEYASAIAALADYAGTP